MAFAVAPRWARATRRGARGAPVVIALFYGSFLSATPLAGLQFAPTFPTRAGPPAEESAARPSPGNGLLSLAVPGLGQLREDRRRGWIYLAAEAVGWTFWATQRARGGDLRDEYRTLAWQTARVREGQRVDPDFPYFERMGKWDRSGAFDAEPDRSGLQPERDPTTYNGSIWGLARGLFLSGDGSETDPGWARALAYYEERAYAGNLRWDWTGAPGARQRYTGLIEDSDRHFRYATNAVGAVLANHIIAAVDAYLTGSPGSEGPRLRIAPVGATGGWAIAGHIEGLP